MSLKTTLSINYTNGIDNNSNSNNSVCNKIGNIPVIIEVKKFCPSECYPCIFCDETPLSGVVVTIDGNIVTTDKNGKAYFELSQTKHTVNLMLSGYYNLTEEIDLTPIDSSTTTTTVDNESSVTNTSDSTTITNTPIDNSCNGPGA